MNTFKLLIVSILLSTLSTFFLKAQKINELVYDSLILAHPELFTKDVSQMDGIITDGLKRQLTLGDSGNIHLTLEPKVIWKKNKNMMQRSLEVRVVYNDSLQTEVLLAYQDNVERKEVSRLRKSKHKSLRGENPGVIHRIAIPVTTIVAGTVGMISLFYIRSN